MINDSISAQKTHTKIQTVLQSSKIRITIPGLIFVQKAFLVELFLGELSFEGAYYWREIFVAKWVGLDNKNA